MKLIILGTGNASTQNCYNTCFAFKENNKVFLVDSGGGNTILKQLNKAEIQMTEITDIFLTHRHTDHILGMAWIFRSLTSISLDHPIRIFSHDEVITILKSFITLLFDKKQTDNLFDKLEFITIDDGYATTILNHSITFFDIHSTKATQYGFSYLYDDIHSLSCCGDEPYCEENKTYVINSQWLMHEAFCLYAEADKYHPYEKHHSTVKEACQTAEKLKISHLLLYHTEEDHLEERKKMYREEGSRYFGGSLSIPDDLDSFDL